MNQKILIGTVAAVAAIAGFATDRLIQSSSKKEYINKAKEEGKNEAKAEMDIRYREILNKYELLQKNLKLTGDYFDVVVAMTAVAASCIQRHGVITKSDKQDIENFICGLAELQLPPVINKKLREIYQAPPTIKEAYELAAKTSLPIEFYDDIIHFVSDLHDRKSDHSAFILAWNQLKVA